MAGNLLTYRLARPDDVQLLFHWANERSARENSYNKEAIDFESHKIWFEKKLSSRTTSLYIFSDIHSVPVGQIRLDADEDWKTAVISVSVDVLQRQKGYAANMIEQASTKFLENHPGSHITAYVFKSNPASLKSFINAGYKVVKEENIKDIPSYILEKR